MEEQVKIPSEGDTVLGLASAPNTTVVPSTSNATAPVPQGPVVLSRDAYGIPVAAPAAQGTPVVSPTTLKSARPFSVVSSNREERWLKFLIYGDNGVGKTYLAASAQDVPSMKNVLFIDVESGDLSISNRNDIRVIRIESFAQLARVYDQFLLKHIYYRDKMAPGPERDKRIMDLEQMLTDDEVTEPRIYNTIVLDTVTEIQKYCVYQLLGIKVGQPLDIEPAQTLEFAGWGKLLEMMGLTIRAFVKLPMHVIAVAQLDETQDALKTFHRAPSFQGQFQKQAPGMVDNVGYMVAFPNESGETVRRLYMTPGKTYKGKSRLRLFKGSYIEAPSMQQIYDYAGLAK